MVASRRREVTFANGGASFVGLGTRRSAVMEREGGLTRSVQPRGIVTVCGRLTTKDVGAGAEGVGILTDVDGVVVLVAGRGELF